MTTIKIKNDIDRHFYGFYHLDNQGELKYIDTIHEDDLADLVDLDTYNEILANTKNGGFCTLKMTLRVLK